MNPHVPKIPQGFTPTVPANDALIMLLTAELKEYQNQQKGTGRSHELLDTMEEGDTYVVPHRVMVPMFQTAMRNRGLTPHVQYYPVEGHHVGILPQEGKRLVYDHTWIEEHWNLRLRETHAQLKMMTGPVDLSARHTHTINMGKVEEVEPTRYISTSRGEPLNSGETD